MIAYMPHGKLLLQLHVRSPDAGRYYEDFFQDFDAPALRGGDRAHGAASRATRSASSPSGMSAKFRLALIL